MVHVLLVARAVVHVDEFVLVVVLRAASTGRRTRRGAVLVAGLARFALLLLHALVLGAPVLEPHFDLLRRGREKKLVRNLLRNHILQDLMQHFVVIPHQLSSFSLQHDLWVTNNSVGSGHLEFYHG